VVGFICIYVELHLMTGVLSIVAALCFALFFWSHFLGGCGLAGSLLFLIGAVCLRLRILSFPESASLSDGRFADFFLADSCQPTWHNIEPNEDYKRLS